MTHIPDPEDDFDGCIAALYDQAARGIALEIEGMTEAQQDEHFLMKSIEHLVTMYELDAPRLLIKMAHESLNKKLRRLRDRSRASQQARHENPRSNKPRLRAVRSPSDCR